LKTDFNCLLFLDVDGVLRNTAQERKIVPELAQLIHQLAEDLNAGIIITSTWRLVHSLRFFQREISPRVFASMPSGNACALLDEQDRGKFIRLVVERHFGDDLPHVIFDDQPSLFPGKKDKCVFTNPETLITEVDIEEARKKLLPVLGLQRKAPDLAYCCS